MFPKLFSDRVKCMILETFIENPKDILSVHEIRKMIDVTPLMDIEIYINKLIKEDIIHDYTFDDGIKMYQLNTDNKIVKILMILEYQMTYDKWDEKHE